MTIQRIPVGRTVLCDLCDADWTERPESGGMIVQSKGVCPTCKPKYHHDLIRYEEEYLIKAECPSGVSFADWLRALRGPDAEIVIRTGEDFDLNTEQFKT